MINNKNIDTILKELEHIIKKAPEPAIEKVSHKYHSAFHILIATILSSRTKDETTIKVSRDLFSRIKDTSDLIKIPEATLKKILYPVGFYKVKTKHLKMLGHMLKKKFNDIIPDTLENLITLPGVGRKTANLVLILAFDKYGICVDTHVHRIVNRWGYVKTKLPNETETALREKLPKKHWKMINYILVSYGKIICKPITPICTQCPLISDCPYPASHKHG